MAVNYIRKKVSADRRRYQNGETDLDMTYIVSNLLGMFFFFFSNVEFFFFI